MFATAIKNIQIFCIPEFIPGFVLLFEILELILQKK